jgi:tetratricopeptide (TPR) repeat protein
MIVFPSESLYELRRSLVDRMESGELNRSEAFRQALAADPNDALSWFSLAIEAEQAGNLDEAERLAREGILNHPSAHSGYMLLQRILSARGADPQLVEGYAMLGLEKVAYDEDAIESIDFRKLLPGLLTDRDRNYELLQMAIEHLKQKQLPEPPAVLEELEPHRLIHQLREAGEEPLPEELIDGIVAGASKCAPMLMGILKEFGEDQIPEEDDFMVFRAVALLGEIGDLAALPAITEFLDLENESFCDIARWAFHRISFRQPEAALKVIRTILPESGPMSRASLALQIAELPNVPGRFEALESVLDGLERQPQEEQEALLVGAITGAWVMEGVNSDFAASLLKKYGSLISASTHKDLKKLRGKGAGVGPYVATEDPVTIYEICGQDHSPIEQAVKPPTPGRNDPCWCGSGKKYKKCHLDADEGR